MRIMFFVVLTVSFVSTSALGTDLVPENVECPVYIVKDQSTVFDTSLQGLLEGGDESYTTLGINRVTKNVKIGYFGWSYPEDKPEYKVSVKTSGYKAIATVKGPEGSYKISYDHSNGCMTLRHAFKDPINGRLSSGNIIAEARCTKNSDEFDYEKLSLSDLDICREQPDIGTGI